jgi:hypothetical protein
MTATLDEDVMRSTLTAMVTLIMGRNDSTRPRSEEFTMKWKGETVGGKFAAERVLLESLSENAPEWARYLADPANRKVLVSMDVALDDNLGGLLETMPEGVAVVDVIRESLDNAPLYQPAPGEHRVIDLREAAKQPVDAQ